MFDFLGLPREIRDEIYKLCLVREKIEFEEFYTDETPEEWMKDRRPDALTLHIAKPDETPLVVYQGVPFVHRVESLTPIDGRSRWDDIYDKDRTCSYRICRHTTDLPCLSIFRTNRLVYQEASVTFYGNNVFHFPSKGCETTLNACSAFLEDRPQRVRTYLHNISLSIGDAYRYVPVLEDNGKRLYYGVHLPTMTRLGLSLRRLMTLNELSIVLEEQNPTERMLKSLLQKQDYVDMFERPSPLETIPVRQCLKIGIGNNYDIQHQRIVSTNLAYRISKKFYWSRMNNAPFVSSEILVEGKKMTSSIFTYLVPKARRG